MGYKPLSFETTEDEEGPPKIKEKEGALKIVVKYFVHGIAFSLLFALLVVAWAFGLVMLVVLGSFIGLAIGVAVLILIVGFLNAVITTQLWFEVKTGFWDLLLHGLVLLIVLVIVNGLLVTAPSLVFPGIPTTIITFIIGTFVNGFVGRKVAEWWSEY